jgi:hypothetical protein
VFSDELRALSPVQIAARVGASTRDVLRQALGK